MSDWRPRLIASDMDGTLLRSDDTVGEATVAEIARWRADGVPFVLATGRPPRWMHRIREVLGTGTAVCCNGAVLLDLGSMEIEHEEALDADTLRSVTDALRERQPTMWFAVEYGWEFRHEPVYRPRWDVNVAGVAVATLEEWVTVARSPTISSMSSTKASGVIDPWRASSLAAGAAAISSRVATATPGTFTSHRGR